ncbi:MAG: aspartate kinase [Planctomycetota bacterium]|nr:aspartate kinase [Planctomycetota bacterium]
MKFGGTSLADRERIDTVVALVRGRLARRPVVVCSAHAGVTDLLLEGAHRAAAGAPDLTEIREREHALLASLKLKPSLVADDLERLDQMFRGLALLGELTPRSLDQVAAFGERMSVKAIAAVLRRRRIPATAVDADEAGLVTDGRFGRATPRPEAYRNLERSLAKVKGVPVVTGFIGRDAEGNVTTLGRSGSDYTATIIGRALGVEEVEIWTDVSGVLTADPRIVSEARPVEHLTYAEASELAYYGAKVIHPSTIQPAVERGIPVRILNTMDPDAPGTVIAPPRRGKRARVTSIASKRGIHLVNIVSGRMLGQSGFMARVFDAFKSHDVIVDLIATSEVSVTVSVDNTAGLAAVVQELKAFSKVTVKDGAALVAVIGERMKRASGLAGRVFSAIGEAGVPVLAISYGATKTNLQIVVPEPREREVVRALHAVLFDGV